MSVEIWIARLALDQVAAELDGTALRNRLPVPAIPCHQDPRRGPGV
ncbi:hypothetical protein [Nocardia sp. R6R-6]